MVPTYNNRALAIRIKKPVSSKEKALSTLKKLIWAYYLLLIFEGAFRKWVLPGLSSPLLLIREPVAILIIFIASRNNLIRQNGFLFLSIVIAFLSIITAVFLGHGNIIVAVYGARILLLHFPLIYIMGNVLSKEDIIKIGNATMLIAIPMVILTALQFYSPQSALVNRAVGGEEGIGFEGANGYFRPPGTFSFTNGNSLFFSFVAPFVVNAWFNVKNVNKLLLIAATLALILSIPLSISRTLFFQVGITALFAVVVALKNPKHIGKVIAVAFIISIAFILSSRFLLFQTATDAFSARLESANRNEGGAEGVFVDRFLGGLILGLTTSVDQPFFGLGTGAGTGFGSTLLSGGSHFLGGEGEWARLVIETGAVFGLTIILIRSLLSFSLLFDSFKAIRKGDIMPWLLMSFGFLTMLQGGWAQPTSLGFFVIIGGLVIASLKQSKSFIPRALPQVALKRSKI